MSSAHNTATCRVCNAVLYNNQARTRHMQRWHPAEWVNSGGGRQITYYPCDMPGCDKLDDNIRSNYYIDHLSMSHGLDIPSMLRTTEYWYLFRKTKDVLQRHVIQEAAELNDLNTKLRGLERCLAADAPGDYASCHGLDTTFVFETNLVFLPQTKEGLTAYLQRIRNCRKQVGSLYTRPGVMDTRDGVLDDLETLLDWL